MKMDMTSDPPILRSASLAAGTGAPVLLLHGSASAAVMWVPVIDALKSRFRVIAPDLDRLWPNRFLAGRSWLPVDDELRLVEPLLPPAPAGVHVVGHSYGGVVALHLALAGRVPIRSLTLIEPVAFFVLPHAGAQAAWLEIEDARPNLCGADRGRGNANGAARLHRLLGGPRRLGCDGRIAARADRAGARERSSSTSR